MIRNDEINMLLNMVGIPVMEATAYHGSGSLFNKFDMTYLGKGEGFIAHGWGLYFAKNKSTAEHYKDKLGNITYAYKDKVFPSNSIYNTIIKKFIDNGKKYTLNWLNAVREDKQWMGKYERSNEIMERIIKFIKKLKVSDIKKKITVQTGFLYEVTLPDDEYYLDEDKLFDKQTPYVQDCLTKLFKENNLDIQLLDTLKKDIYKYIYLKLKPKSSSYTEDKEIAKKASELLYEYGIKGIKYYGLNDGDCYVIFNDKDIKINEVSSKLRTKLSRSNVESPEEMYKEILDNPEKIKDLKNLPEHLIIELIENDPKNIKYIENPSEQVQLEAVKQYGDIIRYIKNPTERVKLEAVKNDGYAIKYIKNPSEQVQLEAVKQYGDIIRYIKNPSEQVQLKAVKQYGDIIRYIKNPTERVQLLAVKDPGYTIKYIKNPSEEVQLEAVKSHGLAINYIDNPSEKVQLEAVKSHGFAIKYIDNPSEKVQLEAVKQNGGAIEYIENPSEEVQIEAIKNNGHAIEYIRYPTLKVKALYQQLYGDK